MWNSIPAYSGRTLPGGTLRIRRAGTGKRLDQSARARQKKLCRAIAVNIPNGSKGRKLRARAQRGNPADAAAAKYEEFHGRPSEETVTVKREIHYHKHLAALGELKKLVVVSREGYKVPIDRFKGATLCENEKGTQLYVEGGDQSVGLDQFGIDPDEAHEMEVLGDVLQVLYFTRKDHLGKEGGIANYDHKFEEPYPELQYDVRNEQLIFSGGRYVILPEGVDR